MDGLSVRVEGGFFEDFAERGKGDGWHRPHQLVLSQPQASQSVQMMHPDHSYTVLLCPTARTSTTTLSVSMRQSMR